MLNLSWARRTGAHLVFALALLASASALSTTPAPARKGWTDSPLAQETQVQLERCGRLMKSGKFEKAKPGILGTLDSATDVPKCLAIAAYTEPYAYPMMEVRRQCLQKALSLASTREDTILVALKSRQYSFFEITRQAVNSLIQNAKNVPDLFDLARKSQEVALNDVAHLAMEKAYTGIKTEPDAYAFAEQAHALGMDDLLRKVIKDMIDDEDSVPALCDLILKFEGYHMRDQSRYGLRKALDLAKTVADMQDIFEASRRLNEPDIANRAQYFVRKGQLIQKMKQDRGAYEAKMRSWKEGVSLDAARARDAAAEQQPADSTTGLGGSRLKGNKQEAPTSGF